MRPMPLLPLLPCSHHYKNTSPSSAGPNPHSKTHFGTTTVRAFTSASFPANRSSVRQTNSIRGRVGRVSPVRLRRRLWKKKWILRTGWTGRKYVRFGGPHIWAMSFRMVRHRPDNGIASIRPLCGLFPQRIWKRRATDVFAVYFRRPKKNSRAASDHAGGGEGSEGDGRLVIRAEDGLAHGSLDRHK